MVEIFLPLWSGARRLIVPTLGRFGRRVLQEEVHSAGFSLHVLALGGGGGGEACPSPPQPCSVAGGSRGTALTTSMATLRCPARPAATTSQRAFCSLLMTESSVQLRPPLMETTMESTPGGGLCCGRHLVAFVVACSTSRDRNAALTTFPVDHQFSGGDSLQALRLCDDTTTAVGGTSSGLLEVILDGSFSDVLYHVATETLTLQLEHSWTSRPVAKKHPADPVSSAQPKRQLWRRHWELSFILEASGLGLRGSWQSDTERFVDASPVLFIGSHSHRMQALDLATGGLLWERVSGQDRVLCCCVRMWKTHRGCYDGCVCFLCLESGKTQWVFETGDAVKSCPTVDGHVYALDSQHCVTTLGETSSVSILKTTFFSIPSCSIGNIIIGSVNGNICCLSHTGKCPCVFEGSAWGLEGTLVDVVSTDGTLCVLAGKNGTLRASLSAQGALLLSCGVAALLVVG
ncbi:unnamed protein product [Coregonus sp. 'balchen']|nr:unnamed protein product [Coregonus sp. 'balchen']